MALTNNDWESIYQAIDSARGGSEIVYGKVIARDEINKFIWMEEFGDRPIPLVGLNGWVVVYDVEPYGNTTEVGTPVRKLTEKKICRLIHEVPKIGETAVVLRQFGARRLPKCVGIILSTGNFESY